MVGSNRISVFGILHWNGLWPDAWHQPGWTAVAAGHDETRAGRNAGPRRDVWTWR